ncbi:MAG: MarR family transcriptional regulator [Rhodobacteraceae bacterium]|nr:MarR family transcriptional regulator [Paracoccaceae bacterium]
MMKAPYDLHTALGYLLTLTARHGERRFEPALKSLNLTRITWCILIATGSERLRNPSDIASFIGIDRTATSRALRQMEAQGLITRQSGQKDGRRTEVALTTAGRQKLAKADPLARSARSETEARLTPGELTELTRLLEKLREGDDAPLKML